MDIQVSHSATINVEGSSSTIALSTFYFGGFWKWSGVLLNTIGHDEWGCRLFETVEGVDCGLSFFDNSEDAIAHAVAQFDDTQEDGPEDDYPGDVLPTGWDAVDHKALYE